MREALFLFAGVFIGAPAGALFMALATISKREAPVPSREALAAELRRPALTTYPHRKDA